MKRFLPLFFLLAIPAFSQLGNATRLRGVLICAPLTQTNNYVLVYNSSTGCLELAANGGASGSVTTGGLGTNVLPKATGASALGDSLVTDNGTVVSVGGQFSIKANPFIIELPNSSTGTTNNKLAKAVVNGGVVQAQIITTSSADQASVLGCVISGGGTSGTALIMIAGTGSCYFDSATTAGHIGVPSSTSAGALHDTGSASAPPSGQVIATVGATNACGAPPCLVTGNLFMTPDIVATGGNGNAGGPGGSPAGAKQQGHKVTMQFNGGGSALTTGDLALYPGSGAYSGTINRIDVSGAGVAGVACSATADIWKANAAIPTGSNKISASAPATLSAANLSQSGSRTGWTNTVLANDVWSATLATNSGCVTFTIEVYYQ